MGGKARLVYRLLIPLVLGSQFVLQAVSQAQSGGSSAYRQLAREIFKELIDTNTTHQVGTTKAAEAMARRLKGAGFPDQDIRLVGPRPEQQNLVVRFRGKGSARPVLFIGHLDVVEARKEDWSQDLDPFRLTERDGFLYGRGTVDMKGEDASLVANLIRLKKEAFSPDRDLIVALTADEEGGDANGVDWLLRNRRDLIDAEYCINPDGGELQIENGKRMRYGLQTGEKVYFDFRLEVTNRGGHSSQPVRDNAIYHLAEGLNRLATYEFPARLNETTRSFFTKVSESETGQLAADMRAAAKEPPDPEAVKRLSLALPFYNSIMRTTCVATMLEAGHAPNALPQLARANVNCRLLPGDAPEEIRNTLVKVLADDHIEVSIVRAAAPGGGGSQGIAISSLIPEVVQPVQRIASELWPGVLVVPTMSTGATDGLYLRAAGIPTYGVSGIFAEIDPARAHGKDERVGIEAFYEGVEFMYRLMKALASNN